MKEGKEVYDSREKDVETRGKIMRKRKQTEVGRKREIGRLWKSRDYGKYGDWGNRERLKRKER